MLLHPETLKPAIAKIDRVSPDYATLKKNDSLVAKLKARDASAFDQLVTEQSSRIHRLVSRLLGWDGDAEDVTQEVFIVVWQKIERFRGDSDISTWLYSIALNQCRKARRIQGRRKKRHEYMNDQQLQQLEQAEPNQKTPDAAIVRHAVNQLSQKDRELIVLCTFEEHSLDEVAMILGTRKNTVEVRLHRARKRLKQILKTEFENA